MSPVTVALALVWHRPLACDAGRPTPHLATRAAAVLPGKASVLDEPKFAEVVARSMPAVVLLLNTQADGSVKYGAGLLLEHGLVLTSQHVVADVKTLGAMLYEARRTSYTPMDGGLSRYLFENQAAVLHAQVWPATPRAILRSCASTPIRRATRHCRSPANRSNPATACSRSDTRKKWCGRSPRAWWGPSSRGPSSTTRPSATGRAADRCSTRAVKWSGSTSPKW